MTETEGPGFKLSPKDQEMLDRYSQEIQQRKDHPPDREEKPKKREWAVDLPKRAEHPYAGLGKSSDVKRGDKAEMTSRGTRHDSHPIDSKKIPLK